MFETPIVQELTFRGDASQNGKRLVLVLLYCEAVLVVVARTRQAAIVRDPFLVVNAIVGLSRRTERELFSCVVGRIWFFKVARKFVGPWLWELIVILCKTAHVIREWLCAYS